MSRVLAPKPKTRNEFPVIEDDEQYSPASIAGLAINKPSLAVGEQQIDDDLFDAFSVGIFIRNLPSDARWAILFVAVGDHKKYQRKR